MKKVLFFLAAMLMIPMVHAAPEFKEGVNYDVVKQTGSAQPEVMEFFSYYCPHCATFEPIVEQLKAGLPEGVPLKKNPVAFLGREMGPEMQRAYAVASLLTFFLYWRDKHSALKDRWRTPETTLHLFELAGGWPGALLAQQVFRHKTRKLGYQLLFWLIVVLHQAFWIDLLFIGSGFTRERLDWLLRLL